jgi:hypothetical protein
MTDVEALKTEEIRSPNVEVPSFRDWESVIRENQASSFFIDLSFALSH